MRTLAPTLQYGDADWLAEVIARTKDAGMMRRLQGVRFRMLGYSASQTQSLLGVSPEALRAWIRRWNDGGVEALRTLLRPGRPPALDAELRDVVVERLSGRLPDGTPYTAVAIHGYLKKKDRT
jgi:transposase